MKMFLFYFCVNKSVFMDIISFELYGTTYYFFHTSNEQTNLTG